MKKKVDEEFKYIHDEYILQCTCTEMKDKINNLQSKIDKAIKYYETHQQECVIGRNKDDKLIKDYYLPTQCSKKLYEFLKEVENVENN